MIAALIVGAVLVVAWGFSAWIRATDRMRAAEDELEKYRAHHR